MNTTTIKIADLNIRLEHKYDVVKLMCKDYIVSDNQDIDIYSDASDSDIVREKNEIIRAMVCNFKEVAIAKS